MKIAFFETNNEEEKILRELLPETEMIFVEEKLSSENINLAKDTPIISVFVNSEINKEVINLLPNLKFITTRSTGFDHIDCQYAASKHINVCNVPAYGARTVAEHAFGIILELSRKIGEASRQIKEKNDFRIPIKNFEGFDLSGKTIGIIGTGKIGKNSCHIAKGFNMRVLATDLYPDQRFAEETGVEYVPLSILLSDSDIITIHTPYNETTHHLINKENIRQFKKGAYLINTARGEIAETEALLSGLKEGIIEGAGFDVLEGERRLKDEQKFIASGKASADDKKLLALNHELMALSNVIVTPHIAFYTKEAVAEILRVTAENIKSFLNGDLVNLVK